MKTKWYRLARLNAVIAVLAILTGPALAAAEELPWDVRTPFKTAIIKYKLTGLKVEGVSGKGDSTIYIRDHGRERVMINNYSMKGEEGGWFPMDSLTIITSQEVIHIRTEPDDQGNSQRIAKKWSNPIKFYRASYGKLKGEDLENYHKSLRENGTLMDFMGMLFNPEKRKAKKILGYQTDMVNMLGMQMYYMQGAPIPLEGVTFMMNFQVTGIQKNVSIPDKVFQPPAGIKIEFDPGQEDSNRQYAEMNIEGLGSIMSSLKGLENLLKKPGKTEKAENQKKEVSKAEATKKSSKKKKKRKAKKKDDGLENSLKKGLKSLKNLFGN